MLAKLEKPVLIVHGKDDPLVPAWVAEEHHELAGESRLEIVNGSHFFTLGGEGLERAVQVSGEFLNAVQRREKVEGARYETSRQKMKAIWRGGPEWRGFKPWWVIALLCGIASWWKPRLALFLAALGGAALLWDALLAIGAVVFARLGRRWLAKEPLKKRGKWFPLLVWVDLCAGSLLGGLLLRI